MTTNSWIATPLRLCYFIDDLGSGNYQIYSTTIGGKEELKWRSAMRAMVQVGSTYLHRCKEWGRILIHNMSL